MRPPIKRPLYRPSVSLNSFTASTVPTRSNAERVAKHSSRSFLQRSPLTTEVSRLAGKLDAERQILGVVIPFAPDWCHGALPQLFGVDD
jgi:hypothetical protein